VLAPLPPAPADHLTPHDIVTYSRCPHEMELHHLRKTLTPGVPPPISPGTCAEHHSPLLLPPVTHLQVFEGRIDIATDDILVYFDEHERDLPVLFPPDRVRPDSLFTVRGINLIDLEWHLSGRPDFVVRRAGGGFVPIEYKSTHIFAGPMGQHGRAFDVIQAIAECRLVHAVSGSRPSMGIVLYGDASGSGAHEGWMEVAYGEAEERWLRYALALIRGDHTRSPVPQERNCSTCEMNREHLCSFAACAFARSIASSHSSSEGGGTSSDPSPRLLAR
jgi:hypothetical protein